MDRPRISVLVPTRGRPASVARLVDSCDRNAAGPVEFVFYIDDDDVATEAAVAGIFAARGGLVQPLLGPRIVLSRMWNECAGVAQADVMMHCGDDIVFRTPRWDDLVLEAFDRFDDRIVFVHGNDLLQRGNLGTHGFLHRRWVEAVGYFVPPYFASDYNDTWLTEVADMIGRRVYLPELVTEHMHPLAGKGEWDLTHRERLERGQRDNVGALYAAKATERAIDAGLLRTAIEGYARAAA